MSTLDIYSRLSTFLLLTLDIFTLDFFTLDSRLFSLDSRLLLSTLDFYSRLSTITLDSRHLLSTLDPRLLDTLNFYPPKPHLYIIVALVFRIIVTKKKSVTHCQQVLFIVKVFCVHKVFIALFVEYPLCFLLCHNLHLHMLKTCSIGKTVLSVSCARFKSHICKLRLPPPL